MRLFEKWLYEYKLYLKFNIISIHLFLDKLQL